MCVVNKTFIDKYFNASNKIGTYIKMLDLGEGLGRPINTPIEVIGIMADEISNADTVDPIVKPTIFLHYQEFPSSSPAALFLFGELPQFAIKTKIPADQAAEKIRQALRIAAPNFAEVSLEMVEDDISIQLSNQKFGLTIGFLLSFTSLVLSMFGVYSLLTFAVTNRSREFAIKIALGATRLVVIRSIVRYIGLILFLAVMIGGLCAIPLCLILRSWIQGVRPFDPTVIIMSLLVVVSASLLAGIGPAVQAGNLDPVLALRSE